MEISRFGHQAAVVARFGIVAVTDMVFAGHSRQLRRIARTGSLIGR